MRTLFASNFRFGFLIIAVLFCFSAVLAKLWWLHVREAPRLREEAVQSRNVYRELDANRGLIVDSRGAVLADTKSVWDIGVDPYALSPEDEKRAGEVAQVLNLHVEQVKAAFEKHVREDDRTKEPKPIRWAKLTEERPEEDVKKIEALKIKGVYGTRRYLRSYPAGDGKLAAHLIGYMNKDTIPTPVMGIEKAMNSFLVGQRGSIESLHDGRRTELTHLRIRQIDPIDGQNVELTIDSVLQEMCEQELEKVAADYQPNSAIIIVSEPQTGKLLALANWPTFDLNRYNDSVVSPQSSQKNRAVTDVYEPGSVFKIVSISMGLNEGLITPKTTFDCSSGSAPYRGRILALPKDSHAMGTVDVREIVAESSNRGSVLVALRVAEARGEQTLYDYAYNFGFGQATGLITGAESVGLLSKPKNWDGLTITRFPMGHAVAVTPLQMHYAMATVANDGKLMEPMLVNRVINSDGTTALEYKPKERGAPIKPETAKTLADMLRGVCAPGGTAAKAGIEGYDVAGKTGTTQKIINGRYSTQHHVASFSGFFPARKPQYVITVIIDEPRMNGIGYGGKVAAPVFHSIAQKIITQFNVERVSTASTAPHP